MYNCYRKCHTTRELVEFCSGYYPNIAKWVRAEKARGVDADTMLKVLRAIKAKIIRKHEHADMPENYLMELCLKA